MKKLLIAVAALIGAGTVLAFSPEQAARMLQDAAKSDSDNSKGELQKAYNAFREHNTATSAENKLKNVYKVKADVVKALVQNYKPLTQEELKKLAPVKKAPTKQAAPKVPGLGQVQQPQQQVQPQQQQKVQQGYQKADWSKATDKQATIDLFNKLIQDNAAIINGTDQTAKTALYNDLLFGAKQAVKQGASVTAGGGPLVTALNNVNANAGLGKTALKFGDLK